MRLIFEVPDEPRPNARSRRGQSGHGGGHHWYTPDRTGEFRDRVAWCTRSAYQGPVVTERMVIGCVFATSNARTLDVDNLVKAIKDAMEGIVYKNDAQVWLELNHRIVARPPRTHIWLETMSECSPHQILDWVMSREPQ